jgi:AbrB family looped-hinge helix DNA binding protein
MGDGHKYYLSKERGQLMKEILTVLTRKGQTTIPAEIRRALDLKEGDKIVFVLDAGQVCVKRGGSIVSRTAGILKTHKPSLTAEELREAAEQAIAGEATDRGGG